MELYTVKKGKHYFKGDKTQSIYLQLGLTFLGIILGFYFALWWIFAIAFIIYFVFYNFAQGETASNSIRVFFDKSCLYQLNENYDQVNKLYGFSEGFHHWNSARIGWRCVDNKTIELLAYCYINGKRVIKPMIKVKTDNWIFCNIQNKNSKYVFKALIPNSQSITVSIDKDKKWSVYNFFKLFIYKLYPYFGGKTAAPDDMKLKIIKLQMQ